MTHAGGACRSCPAPRCTTVCAAQFPKSCSPKQKNKTIGAIFTPFSDIFFQEKKEEAQNKKQRENHLVVAWSEPYHIVDILAAISASGWAGGRLFKATSVARQQNHGQRAVMGTWRRTRPPLSRHPTNPSTPPAVAPASAQPAPANAHVTQRTTDATRLASPSFSMVMLRSLPLTHTRRLTLAHAHAHCANERVRIVTSGDSDPLGGFTSIKQEGK